MSISINFIKAKWQNNVYRILDFYENQTATIRKLPTNTAMDVDMKFSDNVAFFTTQILTVNGESIRNYTHIWVEYWDKVYKITSIDQLNYSSATVFLEEDPLIANLSLLLDTPIVATRTNNTEQFFGLNDTPNLTLTKSSTIENHSPTRTINTGKWALIFMYGLSSVEGNLMFDFNIPDIDSYEKFGSLTALRSKYPEVSSHNPNLVYYFEKIVNVAGVLHQCIAQKVGTNTFRLKWETSSFSLGSITIPDPSTLTSKRYLNEADIDMWVMALPLNSKLAVDNGDGTITKLRAFESFIKMNHPALILDIKIIDGSHLPILQNLNLINGAQNNNMVPITVNAGAYLQTPGSTPGNDAVGYIWLQQAITEIDVSINDNITGQSESTAVADPKNFKPFKRYFLNIYGNKHEVNLNYAYTLKLKMAINSNTISYILFSDTITNIVASGSIINQLKWQADKLDLFLQQNPSYKDIFNLKQNQKFINSLLNIGVSAGTGAIAGSVVPGASTAVGAAVGAAKGAVGVVGSAVNITYDQKAHMLEMEGYAKAPDELNGDSSSMYLQLLNPFGIYWTWETPVNGFIQMNTQLDTVGFPTNQVIKIKNQIPENSVVYNDFSHETCIIIAGYALRTIKNNQITNHINAKLKEGIVLI